MSEKVVQLQPGMKFQAQKNWRVVIVTLNDSGLPIHESVMTSYSGKFARENAIAFAAGFNLGGGDRLPQDNKIAIVEGLAE